MGKTALGLDIALNVARQDQRVMVYSLEMTADRLANRLLSRMTDIPGGRIVRGKLDGDELRAVKRATEELKDIPLAITDETFDSERLVEHATEWAERAEKRGGPPLGLLVIDYVSLLRDVAKFGENERVGRISNNIRALARPDNLNIPIVLLVQLNRQVDGREGHIPTLSDIRDSGSLEQDAHSVIFCFRPYYYELMNNAEPLPEERDAALIIAKNREGPQGKTRAVFRPSKTMWLQERPEGIDPAPVKKTLKQRVREERD
jgi:replicative DNA helicase